MNDSVKQAIQLWCGHFANEFKLKTDETMAFGSFKQKAFFDSAGGDRWIEQKFSPESGTAWLYVPENTWELLSAPFCDGESDQVAMNEIQHAILGAVARSFSAFARDLSTDAAGEIKALSPEVRASPPPEVEGIAVKLETSSASYSIGFVFDQEWKALVSQLESRLTPASRKVPLSASRLDLLLEVELPITVLIGSTQMPLRDVLNLTTGSIVELDRLITDPVDLYVNRRLIARGEVVVIEGNYGVRILEVVSRYERLALRDAGQSVVGPHVLRGEATVGQ
jgi:flagellar motor switch protein FliN/FliY